MEYSQKNDDPHPLLCFQYNINPSAENKINLISNYNSFIVKLNKKYPSLKPIKMKENKPEDYEEYIKLDDKRNFNETDLFSIQNIGKILMMKRNNPQIQPTQPSCFQNQQHLKTQSPDGDNIIRNNLNFPNEQALNNLNGNDNHNESTIGFFPNMIPKTNDIQLSLSGGEDIDKLIVLFPQLSDIKTKSQTIKKFIAYYRKNKYDEAKITSFFMSLSSQINESSSETKSWIQYEYLRTRLESSLTAICKEMAKLIGLIQSNNVSLVNGIDMAAAYIQPIKKLLINKIREYLNYADEEEKTIVSKPFINKFLDTYNPKKGKKKEAIGFYKDRLNKKIKEMFEKNQIQITAEKIALFFFQPDTNNEVNDNTNTNNNNDMHLNSLNERNSLYNSIDNSSKVLEDDKNIHNSHNNNININAFNANNNIALDPNRNLNHSQMISSNSILPLKNNVSNQKKTPLKNEPKASNRFRINQFSDEDF